MKKIFLLYPYYWPGFKAGGPVQSHMNLVRFFSRRVSFFLISQIEPGDAPDTVRLNQWNAGPYGEQVYLTDSLSFTQVHKLIQNVNPDVLYVNGIFTAVTALTGLWYARRTGVRTIVSPRGMLQSWALQKKGFKKIIYLALFKLIKLSVLEWHATTEQEAEEIRLVFGSTENVKVAPNIPHAPVRQSTVQVRQPEEPIRLVFLSLLNSNKNLELIIDALVTLRDGFTLDIYGPVVDEKYWRDCQAKIEGKKGIRYKGVVPPEKVQEVLSMYHFFILPTLGENFGHAIFDALSVGLPVIISRHTPWQNIDGASAGFYIEALSTSSIADLLLKIKDISMPEHAKLLEGALQFATNYFNSRDYNSEYQFICE